MKFRRKGDRVIDIEIIFEVMEVDEIIEGKYVERDRKRVLDRNLKISNI